MTVHARRIGSVPKRTPSETWRAICDLIVETGSPFRADLDRATGLASMLIAEEYSRRDAIILTGSGPQIRFYTLHGEDALDNEGEDPLVVDPTASEWRISLPCGEDDLAGAQTAVEKLKRFEVRPLGAPANRESQAPSRSQPVVDLTELESE